MPRVSVMMPVYNGEKYLRETIDSILAQTYKDFEFIIVDDASTDSSAEIVRSYDDERIKFFQYEQNGGYAGAVAFNRGLDHVTGEYIARMDADDISLPGRFAEQVKFLDAHPDVDVCGCDVRFFGAENHLKRYPRNPQRMKASLLYTCSIIHPSVMMRSSLFTKGGFRYDPEYDVMADHELWYRISREHNIVSIGKMLFYYRIHSTQSTFKLFSNQTYLNALRHLHERQAEELGLPTSGEEFDAFFSVDSECDLEALNRYCKKMEDANKYKLVYDQKELGRVLDTVFIKYVNKEKLVKAIRIMRASERNWFLYGCSRVVNNSVYRIRKLIWSRRR